MVYMDFDHEGEDRWAAMDAEIAEARRQALLEVEDSFMGVDLDEGAAILVEGEPVVKETAITTVQTPPPIPNTVYVHPITTFMCDGQEYEVSSDLRIYRKVTGLVTALVTAAPTTSKPVVAMTEWKHDHIPPLETLAWLHDHFFRKYSQETFMLYGKKRDGTGWEFIVPKQEGTSGSVDWEDEVALGTLLETCRWVGTIHSHPWFSPRRSGVDHEDWIKPGHGGLHLIFGDARRYTLTGSVVGHCFDCGEGVLPEVAEGAAPVPYLTSGGKPESELIQLPKWKQWQDKQRDWKGRGTPYYGHHSSLPAHYQGNSGYSVPCPDWRSKQKQGNPTPYADWRRRKKQSRKERKRLRDLEKWMSSGVTSDVPPQYREEVGELGLNDWGAQRTKEEAREERAEDFKWIKELSVDKKMKELADEVNGLGGVALGLGEALRAYRIFEVGSSEQPHTDLICLVPDDPKVIEDFEVAVYGMGLDCFPTYTAWKGSELHGS